MLLFADVKCCRFAGRCWWVSYSMHRRLSAWQHVASLRVVDNRQCRYAVLSGDVSAAGVESKQRGQGRRVVFTHS